MQSKDSEKSTVVRIKEEELSAARTREKTKDNRKENASLRSPIEGTNSL